MNALPSPRLTDSSYVSYHHPPHKDSMKALLASSWHALEQAPPPSLREILDAYKSKGDGDRDLLMAMLSAKSAEDQRLASTASLHRTMLELYQSPLASSSPLLPLPVPVSEPLTHAHTHVHPSHSYSRTHSHTHHFPSPTPSCAHPHHAHTLPHDDFNSSHPHSRHRTESSASPTSQPRPAPPPPRKRRRTSRSPPPPRRAAPASHNNGSVNGSITQTHETPAPLSPYSSAGSVHSTDSPRSRESMTIGALLSSQPQTHLHNGGDKEKEDHIRVRDSESKRRISSERSTTNTTVSPREKRDK